MYACSKLNCHVCDGAAAVLSSCMYCARAGVASKAAGKAPGEEITAAQLNQIYEAGGKEYAIDKPGLWALGECALSARCTLAYLLNGKYTHHLLLHGWACACSQLRATRFAKQACV